MLGDGCECFAVVLGSVQCDINDFGIEASLPMFRNGGEDKVVGSVEAISYRTPRSISPCRYERALMRRGSLRKEGILGGNRYLFMYT